MLEKDKRITDNGDGTLTILILATGNAVLYGANGKAIARNPGQVRFELVVAHNGTPNDRGRRRGLVPDRQGVDRAERRLLRSRGARAELTWFTPAFLAESKGDWPPTPTGEERSMKRSAFMATSNNIER